MQVSAWRLGVLASLAPTPAMGSSEEFWTKMYLLKAWRVSKRWKLERNLQLKSKLQVVGLGRPGRPVGETRGRGQRHVTGDAVGERGTPPRMRHTEGQPRRRRRGFGRDTPADEGPPFLMQLNVRHLSTPRFCSWVLSRRNGTCPQRDLAQMFIVALSV